MELTAEQRILLIAHYASLGWPQKTIVAELNHVAGPQLGLTQSAVSRALGQAARMGWLERRPFLRRDLIDPSLLAWLDGEYSGKKGLWDELGALVEAIHGPRAGQLPAIDILELTDASHDAALTFGAKAGEVLRPLIGDARVFAVTWGFTVRRVLEGLETTLRRHGVALGPDIKCLPLNGEPLGSAGEPLSSTRLAAFMRRVLTGATTGETDASGKSRVGDAEEFSLAGVPLFVPTKFTEADKRGIRKLIRSVASYDKIFGTSKPNAALVRKVDLLLTSAGTANNALGFSGRVRIVDEAQIDLKQLRASIDGDVGGVLLPRDGLDQRRRRRVDGWSEDWAGVKREHLEAVVGRAAKRGAPGVVLCAMGEKEVVVDHAVRLGLCNRLIIDRTLAERWRDSLAARLDDAAS